MPKKWLFLSGILVCLCWVHSCLAGMLLELEDSQSGRFYFACQDGSFKLGTEEGYTLIDLQKETFYTVYPKEKIYTGGSLKELEAAMAPLKKQLQQLKNMGLDPSVFLEKGPPKTPNITYKPTKQRTKILGYPAVSYLELENGRPVAEVWVSQKVLEQIEQSCSYQAFFRFMERLRDLMSSSLGIKLLDTPEDLFQSELTGFPLKITYKGGKILEVKRLERKHLPASFFEVPRRFKKRSFGPVNMGY